MRVRLETAISLLIALAGASSVPYKQSFQSGFAPGSHLVSNVRPKTFALPSKVQSSAT